MAHPGSRAPRVWIPAVGDRRHQGQAEAWRAPTRRLGVRAVAGPWLALLVGRGRTWGEVAVPVQKRYRTRTAPASEGSGIQAQEAPRHLVGQAQLRQVPIRSSR